IGFVDDFEVGFAGDADIAGLAGKGRRVADGGGGIEPDPAAVGEGEFVLAAAGRGHGVIYYGAAGAGVGGISDLAVGEFHDAGAPLFGDQSRVRTIQLDLSA